MKNYTKTNIGNEGRVELHETLCLTGAEISINQFPAGASVPFVHSHKNNEEIYGILSDNHPPFRRGLAESCARSKAAVFCRRG